MFLGKPGKMTAILIGHHHRNQHLAHVYLDGAFRRRERCLDNLNEARQSVIGGRKPGSHAQLLHRILAVTGTRQCLTKVEVRIRIFRRKLCGNAKFLKRRLRVSKLEQRNSQIVMSRRRIGFAADGLTEFGFSVGLIADSMERKAQLISQIGNLRVEPDSLLKQLDCIGRLRLNQRRAARQQFVRVGRFVLRESEKCSTANAARNCMPSDDIAAHLDRMAMWGLPPCHDGPGSHGR